MKKIDIFVSVNILLASILGIYGQSISYYISDNIGKINPIYCLTILTPISVLLFLTTYIVICKLIKKQEIEEGRSALYLIINTLAGVSTSLWSLFVLLMWWS